MVKMAFQHFLYDFCLGVLIDNIANNFGMSSSTIPKKGDFFKRVSHKFNDEHFFNCQVINVEAKLASDGDAFYIIYLKYDYAKGADFDEWQHRMQEYDELNESDEELDEDDEELLDEMDEVLIDVDDEDFDDEITEGVEYIEFDDYIGINSQFYDFYA